MFKVLLNKEPFRIQPLVWLVHYLDLRPHSFYVYENPVLRCLSLSRKVLKVKLHRRTSWHYTVKHLLTWYNSRSGVRTPFTLQLVTLIGSRSWFNSTNSSLVQSSPLICKNCRNYKLYTDLQHVLRMGYKKLVLEIFPSTTGRCTQCSLTYSCTQKCEHKQGNMLSPSWFYQ